MQTDDGPNERERRWVGAARRGDAQAFGKLVDLYWTEFLVLARRVLGDHHAAQDAVQESFLRMQQHMRRLGEDSNFGGWASRIVRNIAVDRLRAERRRAQELPESSALAETVCEPEPPELGVRASQEHEFRDALRDLEGGERHMLLLRYGRGMSYGAIAAEYGVPVARVKVAIYRGRAKLIAALDARGARAL